jgi:hypothetical protein
LSSSSSSNHEEETTNFMGSILNSKYIVLNKICGGAFSSVWLSYNVQDDTFYIIDRFDTIMPLQDFTKDQYINFLVLSGGEFVDMFILYQKKQNQLLGFIQNNKVISL